MEDLLPRLTIEEKIRLLKGSGMSSAIGIGDNLVPGAAGTTVGIPRLGIPRPYFIRWSSWASDFIL